MIKLRPFIEKLAITDPIFQLDWDLIEEMAESLDIVAITVTVLQRENIILSDVYGAWLSLIQKLKKLNSNYSNILLNAIEIRFKNITGPQCAPMLACIWLDARFQLSLDTRQTEIAKEHLISLYERVKETHEDKSKSSAPEHTILSEETDPLELFMQSFEVKSVVHKPPKVAFADLLESFDSMKRMPVASDPLKYWKAKENDYPEMYMLVKIVFAVPGSQSAIERNFSALNKTLTKFRASLSDETVERILFLRCNRSLFGPNGYDSIPKDGKEENVDD